MSRLDDLILSAAKRAEDGAYPVDGSFLVEHNVSFDDAIDMSNRLAVALAGFAVADEDLQAQIVMLGAMALSDIPDEIRTAALANLQHTQFSRKLLKP